MFQPVISRQDWELGKRVDVQAEIAEFNAWLITAVDGDKYHYWNGIIFIKGCERCESFAGPSHNQCVYNGHEVGHSNAHCTADGCF